MAQSVPLNGRKAQAARNDEMILEAAREVFVADPDAPVIAVAQRAGVGISALYRRYRSKEELLQKLCADGLDLYNECVQAANDALDAGADPRDTFVDFVYRVVDADTHSLTNRLAGTFEPTEVHTRGAQRAGELNKLLVDRLHEAHVLRDDVVVADFGQIFEMIAVVSFGDEERRRELRHRYTSLLLDGLLHHPEEGDDLPGPPPYVGEFASRWVRKAES